MSELTVDKAAAAFYGSAERDVVTDKPLSDPSHDAAMRLYGDTLHAGVTVVDADPTRPKADTDAVNEAWRQGLVAAELSDSEARQLTSLVRKHSAERPDEATVAQWRRQTHQRLRDAFGDDGARERVREVQALLSQSPALKRAIADAGLGDHPDLTWSLVERARTVRNAGRLTGRAR